MFESPNAGFYNHILLLVLFCRECCPGRSTTSKAFVCTACCCKTFTIVVVIFQQDRIKLIINLVTQFGGEFNDGRLSVGRCNVDSHYITSNALLCNHLSRDCGNE